MNRTIAFGLGLFVGIGSAAAIISLVRGVVWMMLIGVVMAAIGCLGYIFRDQLKWRKENRFQRGSRLTFILTAIIFFCVEVVILAQID